MATSLLDVLDSSPERTGAHKRKFSLEELAATAPTDSHPLLPKE
jgi:hypothetical protein